MNWRERLLIRADIASAPCRPLIKPCRRSNKASSISSRMAGDGRSGSMRSSGDAHFRVGTVYVSQGFADFAYGGVSAHSINDAGHGVGGRDGAAGFSARLLRRSFLQCVEAALNFSIGPPLT